MPFTSRLLSFFAFETPGALSGCSPTLPSPFKTNPKP